jgi:hypothetical protein
MNTQPRNELSDMIYLVEFQSVKEFVELPVLASFFQLDVMLLETMQGQFGLIIDEDFQRLKGRRLTQHVTHQRGKLTLAMNFLHVARISFARVALNIMTCLWWGVARKIS